MNDAKSVAHWNDLRAAWWEQGLRIVALLTLPPDVLPETIEFSVAVGSASAYGSDEEPRALVIGQDGNVVWSGAPKDVSDALVARQLKAAKPFPVDPAWKSPCALAFKQGKLVEARDLAAQEDPQGDEAKAVAARVAALFAYWERQATRAAKLRAYDESTRCLALIVKHFAGTEEAVTAAANLKLTKASRDVSKECSAADAYARMRQELARAEGSEKKLAALGKRAEQAAARSPKTRSVERTARLATVLQADPATAALQAFIAKERIKTTRLDWRNYLPKPPEVKFAKGKDYLWHLQTNQGDLTLRLFPDVAPMHVGNAMYLTLLGFYDGLTFHRVIPGFMAQGGCPDGTGSGRIGYAFGGEFSAAVKHDKAGRLSAANAGPDTDSSQFFITFGTPTDLDGKHTIFGELVRGERTLKRIEKLGSTEGAPSTKIVIEKATVTVE